MYLKLYNNKYKLSTQFQFFKRAMPILHLYFYFSNLFLFAQTQLNNYQRPEQQKEFFQTRQYHPVGNISTFFGTSTARFISTQQQQQSIYLNIGSQILPKSNKIHTNLYVHPTRQVIQQQTIKYPCMTRCTPAYRWSETSNDKKLV
jgi:hypothetical protein